MAFTLALQMTSGYYVLAIMGATCDITITILSIIALIKYVYIAFGSVISYRKIKGVSKWQVCATGMLYCWLRSSVNNPSLPTLIFLPSFSFCIRDFLLSQLPNSAVGKNCRVLLTSRLHNTNSKAAVQCCCRWICICPRRSGRFQKNSFQWQYWKWRRWSVILHCFLYCHWWGRRSDNGVNALWQRWRRWKCN